MFEFAASEFDSMMLSRPSFRKVGSDPLVANGSLILGVDELKYSDGKFVVTFIGSSAAMQLKIERTSKRETVVLLDQQYTDFGAVREAVREFI